MNAGAAQCRGVDTPPAGEMLSAAFFARPSDEVAADLIGKVIYRRGFGAGRLSEVEAYLPADDPASHASPGRTRRNAPMFGPPGCIYVFLSYGVHCLLNIVCDEVGHGSAVLIRSFQPVGQGAVGTTARGACGPGLVGRALGIRLEMNGLPLGEGSGVFVIDDGARPGIGRSERVGISRGKDLALRRFMLESRYVSGPSWLNKGRGT